MTAPCEEMGRLVRFGRGKRSMRQFAQDAGVGFWTVFRLERGQDVRLADALRIFQEARVFIGECGHGRH